MMLFVKEALSSASRRRYLWVRATCGAAIPQGFLKPLLLGGFALAISGFAVAGEPDSGKLAKGEAVFMTEAVPSCSLCHTLQKTGASGAIGPDLDAMQPTYDQVRAALREGVGVMPSFDGVLDEAQMDAVATFVEHVTRQ